jgi:hypothetical protein
MSLTAELSSLCLEASRELDHTKRLELTERINELLDKHENDKVLKVPARPKPRMS